MNHGNLHLLISELSAVLVLGKVQNNSSNFHHKWVSLSCKLSCMLSGPRAAASLSDFKCMCICRQSHIYLVCNIRFLLKTRNRDVTKPVTSEGVHLREAGF